jgi:hypothetical protein
MLRRSKKRIKIRARAFGFSGRESKKVSAGKLFARALSAGGKLKIPTSFISGRRSKAARLVRLSLYEKTLSERFLSNRRFVPPSLRKTGRNRAADKNIIKC